MDATVILAAWIAADFLSGLVHWWEDRYGDPSWPWIGTHVIAPNILHHTDQMAFTIGGYWERNWTSVVPAAIAAGAAYVVGWHFLALVLAFLSQANEVHAWAHQRCIRPIRGLQMLGILQSPEQHAAHHRRPFDRNYCVMTDWLNPVLSRAGFWPAAETLIRRTTGIVPRPEREVA
jgi:ubiquitin-conjugating enzyme E2 variant